jgi:hypothetical protein
VVGEQGGRVAIPEAGDEQNVDVGGVPRERQAGR